MKLWPASLAAGISFLVLGGALVILKLHRTIGLGGIGLGFVLVAIGSALLLQERGKRKRTNPELSPSARKWTLRAPAMRALAGVGIIILIGASAFYASLYLSSIQGPTQSFTGPKSTFTSSQNSQTSETSSSSTTISSSSTISALSIALYAGTPTNATARGAASLYIVLQNTGDSTTITSINILRPPNIRQPPIYQCSGPSSCATISAPYVSGRSTSAFNTPTTGFYIGATLLPQTLYGYEVYFANGISLFGTLNSTST